ncbi:K+ transport system, NAD-binding component [Leptolyngbyaceae cyanobacterium JSC-12]|nr:K+ transport system, NAD-binding component [Leptolyngbyaceae cyanobacterium JSC-12]
MVSSPKNRVAGNGTAGNSTWVVPHQEVATTSQPEVNPQSGSSLFLVCGLGSIGQNCVAVLKEYGVKVNAVEVAPVSDWEVPILPEAIANLLIGDCRKPEILEQAGIRDCRAVLLLTNDERVNTEAAFAARLLNPAARLIVRSSKHNLNHFLETSLGNFIAFEPTDLSASAFAFAALGSEIPGYFKLDDRLLRIVKYQIQAGDFWCDRWQVRELNTSSRRVLCHVAGELLIDQFYDWDGNEIVKAGDTLVYVEITDRLMFSAHTPLSRSAQRAKLLEQSAKKKPHLWKLGLQSLSYPYLKRQVIRFWHSTEHYRAHRVATICGLLTLFLLTIGTVFLHLEYPDVSFREALSASFSLLLGGYSDIFGGLNSDDSQVSGTSQLLGVVLTLAGTAFVGVLYALLTEALLTSKFQFFKNRPPVPDQQHVVLIGLNKLGQRIVAMLQELKQPIVGVSNSAIEPSVLPQMPLVVGQIAEALTKVNLSQAKTTIVVLDDDLENLEIGLMVHAANPSTQLVLRTQDQLFSNNVAQLFPYAQVLCAPAVSAEVFAAAAFGENVLSLFHLGSQTVLVTEYQVSRDDTLNGFLLAEIAYGYGVVPVLHQRNARQSLSFLPSDDICLEPGDRLVVLATSESLQRIERGERSPKCWQVQVEKALTRDAIFEGANEITRISGCSLSVARQLMASLPAQLPIPLYKHQAQRLVRHLSKVQVTAHIIPTTHNT